MAFFSFRTGLRAFALSAALGLSAAGVSAETLTDALIRAYQTSPLLDQNRASLRGLDESVPQARAARRPQVSGSTSATFADTSNTSSITDTYRAGLNASLVLFDNGQSRAAIEAARNSIAAGRANLIDVEQIVLFRAVQAFMDVLRDIEFVNLARSDVERLSEQLRAARSRFEVGEVTRTDVSQTEARLAESRATLARTEGVLEIARENYRAVVGNRPGNLAPPPPLPQLPRTLDEAQSVGLRQNPAIIAAQFNERAAVYDFDRALAAKGFDVRATGGVGLSNRASTAAGRNNTASAEVGLSASIPLYTGGRDDSLVRQAQSVLDRRRAEIQEAGRNTRLQVSSAWTELETARATIVANRQRIEAAQIAYDGVVEEARLGARSTLDVLDANQELRDAQAALVGALRNEYVAAYNVLSAMGLLTVSHLNLGIETYDPDVNFARVQSGPRGGYDTTVVDRIRSRWEN